MGKGVQKAIEHVNRVLAPQLVGESVFEQRYLDQKMLAVDGTDNKGNLGANAMFGLFYGDCARCVGRTEISPCIDTSAEFMLHACPCLS